MRILKYVFIYMISLMTAIGLLTLTFAIPSHNIKKNALDSIPQTYNTLDKYETNIKKGNYFSYFFRPDAVSDLIDLDSAYLADDNKPLYDSLYYPMHIKLWEDKITTYSSFNAEHLKSATTTYSYGRYWHGYAMFYRPLLNFFTYNQIRIVFITIFIILNIWLIFLLYKKMSWRVALAFIVATQAILIYNIYLSMFYFVMWLPTYIGSIALLLNFKNEKFIRHIPFFFFMLGSLEIFFSMPALTLNTFCMPLILEYLIIKKNNYSVSIYKIFIKSAFLFFLGIAITWGVKWILADILYNLNLVKDAITNFYLRIFGNNTSEWHEPKVSLAFSNLINMIMLCPFIIVLTIFSLMNFKIFKKYSFLFILFLLPYIFISLLSSFAERHIDLYMYKLQFYVVFGWVWILLDNIKFKKTGKKRVAK